jgi:phosphatidylglycerol:prolipoprotein diacylglycerol transferase
VHPILLQIGSITISTYTALISLGAAVGLAALYWRAPAGKNTRWLDAGLAAMVGGLIGARLVYVAANADYYLPHLEEIVQVWQGGLAWPGAPLAALAAPGFTRGAPARRWARYWTRWPCRLHC